MLGLGVLDDIGERLLDDPVENGLDLAREPGLGQRDSRSAAMPVCSAKALVSRSAPARGRSRRALGRSSTASRRTS